MSAAVFTIGYEGAPVDQFVAALRRNRIETLIDVRAVPMSRRRDYCAAVLARHLAAGGIAYNHFPALGNPEAGRDAARAGDTAAYRRLMMAQLASAQGGRALDRAAGLVIAGPAALMCLERDPARCHRRLVAQALAGRTGRPVVDLFADPLI